MRKARHWFWHIIAIIVVCDFSTDCVSDDEWSRYLHFMGKRGFGGCP